jgi:hypothetical protein
MAIIAEKGKDNFERLENGNYQALCVGVFDLGWQTVVYNGEEKTQHKIYILFEIDERLKTGDYTGKRFLKGKKYTLSLSDTSNLRKDLEAWRNKPFTVEELKGFDVEKVINKHCMVTILNEDSKNGKTYTNIKTLSSVPKGMELMKRELEEGYVPEWIKELQIEESVPEDPYSVPLSDDQIPF